MSEQTWNLAVERSAYKERAFPKVPGQNASLLGAEMSTGHHRIKAGESHHPFQATSCKRSGVKPSSGKVPDTETGCAPVSLDDPMIAEWVAKGGTWQLPAPKTSQQAALVKWCEEALAADRDGIEIDSLTIELIRFGISKVETDDPKQATAFRVSIMGCGIWK